MRTNKLLKSFKFILGGTLLFSGVLANASEFTPLLGRPVNTSNLKVVSAVSCLPKFKELECGVKNDAETNKKCYTYNQPQSEIIYKLIKSEDDLNDVFGVTGHASLNLGSASVNITEGHFKNNQNLKSKKMSLIFYYRFGVAVSLTPEAVFDSEKVSSDYAKICGDSYIAQNQGGILVLAEIQAEFDSAEHKTEAGGEMNGKFGEKLDLGGALDYLASKASSIEKVSMYFKQEGGDAMEISGAVSADSLLGCNFNPNKNKCEDVIRELVDYTKKIKAKYTFEHPSEEMWKIPLYYSGAIVSPYGNKPSPEIDPTLVPLMREIIRKKDGLIGISAELADSISKITDSTKMKTDISNLKKIVDAKIATMDATQPPYNTCFSAAPTLKGCASALGQVQYDLAGVFKAMTAYKNTKPTLSYTVNNIVLLPKTDGEKEGGFFPEETSCYMVKTNMGGEEYRLYCPYSNPVSPGTINVEFKTDSQGKPTREIENLEINTLTSCTTSTPLQAGEEGVTTCAKINYSGDIVSSKDNKTVWKWISKVGEDGTTITPTGKRISGDLFEKQPNQPERKIKPISFVSEYDGYIGWQKDLSDNLLDKSSYK